MAKKLLKDNQQYNNNNNNNSSFLQMYWEKRGKLEDYTGKHHKLRERSLNG